MGQRAVDATGEMARPRSYDDSGIGLGDLMRGERATLGKSLLDVQRDLRIKAALIAAIENVDANAFETPGFISGYLRSYARYLGMDPDRAFEAFCAESGFRPAHGMRAAAPGRRPTPRSPVTLAADRDIFAGGAMPYAPPPEAILSRIEPGAIGSLAVLVALVGAVGWGGWQLLQELQQVTIETVDEGPVAVAEIDPLAPDAPEEPGPVAAAPEPDALDRLYRPRALDVPVLVARDGPIGSLDPGSVGALAEAELDPRRDQITPPRFLEAPREEIPLRVIDGAVLTALSDADGVLPDAPAEADAEAADPAPQVVADPGDEVVLVAARPSWVRVSAADGTVVLEKIMEAGETFAVPRTEAPATLRTGNAGSLYFRVGEGAFGPAGDGPTVISGVELSPEAVAGGFSVADLEGDPELARLVRVAEVAEVEPAD